MQHSWFIINSTISIYSNTLKGDRKHCDHWRSLTTINKKLYLFKVTIKQITLITDVARGSEFLSLKSDRQPSHINYENIVSNIDRNIKCFEQITRGPKGHISCTWVQCATFLTLDRPGRQFLFIRRLEKHNLGRRHWDLASCQVSLNSIQRFKRRSRKMAQPIRGQGGHLVFPISPKNTNLVEDVEILLPVKFRWTPFSDFREEVKNLSANQRPGRPSCFFRSARKTQTW